MSWIKIKPTLYWYQTTTQNTYKKIGMFDLDYTLIKPKKHLHPKNANDWEWLYDDIPNKLKSLFSEDYLLVIISNQSGLSTGKRDFLLDRILNMLNEVNLPIEVYIASAEDIYRKPNTSIFEDYILPKLDKNFTDLFYVGDAAGRPNDFSDTDRKFAYNIHLLLKHLKYPGTIKFYTPEEFFLNEKTSDKADWSGFDPIKFIKNSSGKEIPIDISPDKQYVFILVGPPASGKSTFTDNLVGLFENKNMQIKQITKASELSKNIKNNIVINSTNPSKKNRENYIQTIKKANPQAQIYIVHMNNFNNIEENRLLYSHLNIFRERTNFSPRIPEIVYRIFYKNYDDPINDKNVDKIIQVPFIPKFKSRREILNFMQKS